VRSVSQICLRAGASVQRTLTPARGHFSPPLPPSEKRGLPGCQGRKPAERGARSGSERRAKRGAESLDSPAGCPRYPEGWRGGALAAGDVDDSQQPGRRRPTRRQRAAEAGNPYGVLLHSAPTFGAAHPPRSAERGAGGGGGGRAARAQAGKPAGGWQGGRQAGAGRGTGRGLAGGRSAGGLAGGWQAGAAQGDPPAGWQAGRQDHSLRMSMRSRPMSMYSSESS